MHGIDSPALQELRRNFGHNLSTAIRRRGLTYTEVAARLDVSPCRISRWTAGNLPKWETLCDLAEIVELPPAALLRDDRTKQRHARIINSTIKELATALTS